MKKTIVKNLNNTYSIKGFFGGKIGYYQELVNGSFKLKTFMTKEEAEEYLRNWNK